MASLPLLAHIWPLLKSKISLSPSGGKTSELGSAVGASINYQRVVPIAANYAGIGTKCQEGARAVLKKFRILGKKGAEAEDARDVTSEQPVLALVACQDVTCGWLIAGETEAAAGEEPGL